MTSKQLRALALSHIRGKWGALILNTLLAGLLGGLVINLSFNYNFNYKDGTGEANPATQMSNDELILFLVIFAVAMISAIAVALLVSNIVRVGYSRFLLNVIDKKEYKTEDLFSAYHSFRPSFVLGFKRDLRIFLWSLLFVIPGIVAAYRYSMATFIMVDHPEYTPDECLEESKRIMDGNKGRLFCLELSFIGWIILTALTFGIGGFWLVPYMNTAFAVFYRQLTAPQTEEDPEFVEPELT